MCARGVGSTGLAERLASDGHVVTTAPPAHELVDYGLEPARLLGFILGEVPLDGGQQTDHVLLADLHRSTRPMERCGIGGDAADVGVSSQDEPAARRPAQSLATAEQDEVGAFLRETPQVFSRRELRGCVDDDRDVMAAGRVDQGGQGKDLAREVRLGNVQDRCGARADRALQLVFGLRPGAPPHTVARIVRAQARVGACDRADLDEPAAGELHDRVIRDTMGTVDDEVTRIAVPVCVP